MICIPNTEEMTTLPPHRTTFWVAVEGERAMASAVEFADAVDLMARLNPTTED